MGLERCAQCTIPAATYAHIWLFYDGSPRYCNWFTRSDSPLAGSNAYFMGGCTERREFGLGYSFACERGTGSPAKYRVEFFRRATLNHFNSPSTAVIWKKRCSNFYVLALSNLIPLPFLVFGFISYLDIPFTSSMMLIFVSVLLFLLVLCSANILYLDFIL